MQGLRRWGLAAVALFAMAITWLFLVERQHAGYSWGCLRSSNRLDGVQVLGHSKFVSSVTNALARLKLNAPSEYALIRPYVQRIEQNRRSSADPFRNPPTVYLSARTAFFSPSWCAGAIVHDGYHLRLYDEQLKQNGRPVPDSAWRGRDVEMRCIKLQTTAARSLGAPTHEIGYLEALGGTHFDLDGNGKETWYDHWARDW